MNPSWQKINVLWHYCHWWPDSVGTRITAMFVILVATIALLGLLIALVRAVARDGYGTTPPPRSHLDAFEPQQFVR
jgi:hypothetical protein